MTMKRLEKEKKTIAIMIRIYGNKTSFTCDRSPVKGKGSMAIEKLNLKNLNI